MPSGKVHDRITVAAAVLSVPVWWQFAPPPRDWTVGAMLIGAMLFSGLALSPDLDLDSSIYRRWGPFRFIWWPYQKVVKHRSWVSHSFLLGPLIRTVYFLFMFWGLLRITSYFLAQVIAFDRNSLFRHGGDAAANLWRTHPQHFQMLLLGLFLGAALHSAADLMPTSFKRRRRRR